jgi:tetratricopeptide (TPR) repeat protein
MNTPHFDERFSLERWTAGEAVGPAAATRARPRRRRASLGRRVLVALLALAWAGTALAKPEGARAVCLNDAGALPAAEAKLLAIGAYKAPRVSADDRAQKLFEQGMVFGLGFNFAEAVRSFRAATLADLDCAMCRWGIAWALGPSVNHDMKRADVPIAIDAIVQARAYAPDLASRERALIEALARRYSDDPKADDDQLARGYADAMRRLAARYPDDADIAVLAAEAIMNAHPYDYWRPDGSAQPWTPEVVALLDRATRLAPDHPGAHHYRIHLYEASTTPAKALASADRIGALAPAVGHLVHMPSHIYLRLGRYHDAVLANRAAVESDREYLAAVKANPTYAADYVPHNIHFLWASALWSGESAVALQAAEDLARAADRLPQEAGRRGTRQHFQAAPWLTLVRYQQWDALLARPLPRASDAPYLIGLVHFARGMAFAATGDLQAARAQAEGLRTMERRAIEQKLKVKNINPAADLLAIARSLLASELALARGARAEAVRHAAAAVAAEDRLEIDEPPAWQLPARHALGRALLASGRAQEARVVFVEDLERHPENAVALSGLAAAERWLGRDDAADALERRVGVAWSRADTPLPLPSEVSAHRKR